MHQSGRLVATVVPAKTWQQCTGMPRVQIFYYVLTNLLSLVGVTTASPNSGETLLWQWWKCRQMQDMNWSTTYQGRAHCAQAHKLNCNIRERK